jgi:hypothetical protein
VEQRGKCEYDKKKGENRGEIGSFLCRWSNGLMLGWTRVSQAEYPRHRDPYKALER